MKSEELRRAIGGVDEDLIEGADLKPEKNRQKNVWAIVAPIAAAAAIVLASVIVLPEIMTENRQGVGPGPGPENDKPIPVTEISTEAFSEETERRETMPPTETTVTVAPTESQSTEGPMEAYNMIANRILSQIGASFPYYSAYEYNYVPKDLTELSAWFGTDFAGMASLKDYQTDRNYKTDFIYAKDGALVFDAAHIVYRSESDTITISMSKTTKPYDCLYTYDSEQYSDVEGMRVLVGGSADGTLLSADFESGGIFFRVQMTGAADLNVLAKVIAELVR